ncbi:MAG: response regulator [Candidatus Magnetoovum sp. WYHC-5]|nr:response regulator [Candidatus Magnetoovum sp. WYHC-5]
MKKILIIDDNQKTRESMAQTFEHAGFIAQKAACALNAMDDVTNETYDIILLSVVNPDLNCAKVLTEIKRRSPKTKIIMITAYATVDTAIEAINKGACEYISFGADELITAIHRIIDEKNYEDNIKKVNLDDIMCSLSNSLRRKTIKFIALKGKTRFTDIFKELGVDDNSKVAFHLKMLKESNIIEQDKDKCYKLTKKGLKVLESLTITEKLLIS